MTAKTITVIIGDTHIGGTTALATPQFDTHTGRKDEVNVTMANAAQAWLWQSWVDFWEYVNTMVGVRGRHRKHRLIVVHLGDVVDGDHHRSPQIMPEVEDQIACAVALLQPVVDRCDGFYLTYGTDAHTGGAGKHEIELASKLPNIEHDWEYAMDIDGMLIDVAHHGRAGQRPWTSAAVAMGAEIQLDYAARGLFPPRYVFRGHSHVIDDSGEKLPGTRVVCTPSWQLRTAFGYRVAANKKRSDIGGVILDGDRLDFARARYAAAPGQKRIVKV
jgi:hypothetical protein